MKTKYAVIALVLLALTLTGCASAKVKEAPAPARPVIIGAEGIPQRSGYTRLFPPRISF